MSAIIALGPNAWKSPWRNRQQILSRLAARGWPIVYTSGPLRTWEMRNAKRRASGRLPGFETCDGVACLLAGRVPPLSDRWASYKHLVLRLYASLLKARVAGTAPRILYLFGPKNQELVAHLKSDILVYHAYDRFATVDEATGELRADPREAEALRRADLVLASSELIAEALRAQGRADVRVLPNGVDFAAYSTLVEEPADLGAIPRPRIGYFGRVNLKVDLELVDQLACARPEVHWVIVGEIYEQLLRKQGAGSALDRLRAKPNVHLLGYRPHTSVPAYTQAMDVLSMVYTSTGTGWWHAIYPLKLHEYLATGKPVISTPLATVRPFADVIDICDGASDWLAGIDRALAGGGVGTPDQRREVARDNTWDRRIETLERWFAELTG